MKTENYDIVQSSLEDLEFFKILSIISSKCLTERGRQKVLSLRPLTHDRKYSEAMTLISHYHSILDKSKEIYNRLIIPDLDKDILEIWRKTKEGSSLLPKQIWSIYEFLDRSREMVDMISRLDSKYEVVSDWLLGNFNISEFNFYFSDFEEAVLKSIDFEGNILRDATPQLSKILDEKKKLEHHINRILYSFINDPKNEEFLQEKFVTFRNNRFVIPIKMEYINAVEGFVQDISSSGHTVFVEPKVIQSLSIRYLELVDEEKKEIERILVNLTSKSLRFLQFVDDLLEISGKSDFLYGVCKYLVELNAVKPTLVKKPVVKLLGARHPLLTNPVPIDFTIGDGEDDFGGVIISGPNTSGKTVSIKTVGLLLVMAFSGLLIPSREAEIGYFSKVLVDIGDPQSIEKSLSTFAAHVIRLKKIYELADYNSLVIIDEIGTGTDPKEGEALAVSFLKNLAKKKAKVCVATHYGLVKKLPLGMDYFKNAYMDFSVEELKPLYKLVFGMPGSSNALLIAQKYGLPDNIISEAYKVMVEGVDIYEKFVVEVQNEKRIVEQLKQELMEKTQEIEALKKEYKRKISELEDKLNKVRNKNYEELMSDIVELKSKIENIRKKLIQEKISQKELEEINKEIDNIFSGFSPVRKVDRELIRFSNPKIGDKVFSLKLGREGIISKIFSDGRVEIMSGNVRFITSKEDIFEA